MTYHVDLNISTMQTANALKKVHVIDISHRTIDNYYSTAAAVIKTFVNTYNSNYKIFSCVLAIHIAFDKLE